MSIPTPKHTQTPNVLLDDYLPEMGLAETKVVFAITRKTFGWHKYTDRISISQLMELTGLSNRGVIDGVNAAMDRGIIHREEAGNSYRYHLVIDDGDGCVVCEHDGEDTSQGGVRNSHRGCERSSPKGVSDPHTQKKKKETRTKERESAPAREGVGEMFDALVEAARDVRDGLTQRMESKLMRAAQTLAGEYDPVTAANCLREDLSGAGGKWNAQVFADSVMPEYERSLGDGTATPEPPQSVSPSYMEIQQ